MYLAPESSENRKILLQMNFRRFNLKILILFFLLISALPAKAQFEYPVTLPFASQKASVSQTVGLTDINIVYYSPGVKGREVWGKLVPYGEVWRAGANENTVISFTHDVKIEGKALAAGKYGLHMIPGEQEWTLIFSKNYTSWGSYFYKPEEDALRVNVKPQPTEHTEWLTYEFTDREPKSAMTALRWAKLRVPFKIEVDVDAIVTESLRKELRSMPYWGWTGLCQAADYCIEHNVNIDEAAKWIDRSIALDKNFTNLSVKSKLMHNKGNEKQASELMQQAIGVGNEGELTNYAYQLLEKESKPDQALEILKMSVKKNPESWTAYYNLAQAYQKTGDIKNAENNYKKAITKAPQNQRAKIEEAMKRF